MFVANLFYMQFEMLSFESNDCFYPQQMAAYIFSAVYYAWYHEGLLKFRFVLKLHEIAC